MKSPFLFILLGLLPFFASYAQSKQNILTIQIGYNTTNVNDQKAYKPDVTGSSLLDVVFPGKTFTGDGFAFGISKDLSERWFFGLGVAFYSGGETTLRVNAYELSYRLKGFRVPVSINYLLRNSNRRLRINLGAGVNYINGNLDQFETTQVSSGQTVTTHIRDISHSSFIPMIVPGIQFRIIPNLHLSFLVNISTSFNGLYSDGPCLSLKYSFQKKED